MRTIVISRPPAPLNHPQFSAARRYPVLMQEPARFWARAAERVDSPTGPVHLAQWGHSPTSEDAARAHARERLARLAERVRIHGLPRRQDEGQGGSLSAGGAALRTDEGSYYDAQPAREEVLQELRDSADALLAVITRNRYGSLILTTDTIAFVDIDLPPAPPAKQPLFGRGAWRQKQEEHRAERKRRVDLIASWALRHPVCSVITYETAAGLRVAISGLDAAADSAQMQQVMQDLEADPLYARLCARHATYRARLTAKPWRCGVTALSDTSDYPTTSAAEQSAREEWISGYDAARAGTRAVQRLDTSGPAVSGAAAVVLDLHDRLSGAADGASRLA